MAAYFQVGEGWIEWHLGEPLPQEVLDQRVVTIQADGDELNALISGLQRRRADEGNT